VLNVPEISCFSMPGIILPAPKPLVAFSTQFSVMFTKKEVESQECHW